MAFTSRSCKSLCDCYIENCSFSLSNLPLIGGCIALVSQPFEQCKNKPLTRPLSQDINAVEEAKKNLAARGTPLPEDYCKVVLMRSARE
jgi:hypothetical protein